jgi:hypothetical protein
MTVITTTFDLAERSKGTVNFPIALELQIGYQRKLETYAQAGQDGTPFVIRGVPYNAHARFEVKDDGSAEYRDKSLTINRLDKRGYDRPTTAIRTLVIAAMQEASEAWFKQDPSLLTQAEALNHERETLDAWRRYLTTISDIRSARTMLLRVLGEPNLRSGLCEFLDRTTLMPCDRPATHEASLGYGVSTAFCATHMSEAQAVYPSLKFNIRKEQR